MGSEHTIRLSLTKDYAKSWKIWEGLREIVQNWYDGLLSTIDHISDQTTASGQRCPKLEGPVISRTESAVNVVFVAHVRDATTGREVVLGRILLDKLNNSLHLINSSTGLARKILLLGYSDKSERKEVIGQFGEGLKVGALALVREGRQLVMETQTDKWGFCMERDPVFEEQVLTVQVTQRSGEGEVDIDTSRLQLSPTDTCLTLYPLLPPEWNKFCRRFLFLEALQPSECIKSEAGWLLMAPYFSGQLYVRQIWVADMSDAAGGMLAGANLHQLRLDRDRRSVLHQSELDHTVSAMWARALDAHPDLVPLYLELLVTRGDNCCDTRHAGFYFDNRETAKSLAREFLKKYGQQAYPLSSSGAPLSELKLEIVQNIVLCNNMLVDLLMRSGMFLSREDYLKTQATPGLFLLDDIVPMESLSEEEIDVLRHAVEVVKLVYPQFSMGGLQITRQDLDRIFVTVEKFLEIPRWMMDSMTICSKFNTHPSQAPSFFAHGFLASSIFSTMKQDAGSFPTNHMMVSGVTHGHAAILGSLISQSCALTPPSCQSIHHSSSQQLRWKEREERVQALTQSLNSLKQQMVGRESEMLRHYQSLQQEVSGLEARLEQGEEDFLCKQAALIQSYDDRMKEAEVTSGRDIKRLNEQLVDAKSELAHRQEVVERVRAELEEEKASQSRSSEVSKQKVEILRRMLVERSSALYELVSSREGGKTTVSESRMRELSQLLQQEMKVLEDQRLCVVCATEEKAVVLMPCRHHQLCDTCASQLNICPSCRAYISSRIKVFT